MLGKIARKLLKWGGWTMVGGDLDMPKAVIVAAPHTSNWDAYWAIVYVVATGNDFRVFAKESLFWFPLGPILRYFGCVPLNRSRAASVVQQAVDVFESQESFYLALAPEGTRSRAEGWKSGFYRIAHAANVPVLPGFMDYRRKRLGIGDRIDLTGDVDADMQQFVDFYDGIEGKRPQNASPVRMRPRAKDRKAKS